jgi:hypothetical protein
MRIFPEKALDNGFLMIVGILKLAEEQMPESIARGENDLQPTSF